MSVDPTVIAALRAALLTDPENIAMRLHVGQLLLDGNQAAEALKEATEVLNRQPTHGEALKLAEQASESAGDPIRASGYRRLREALGMASAQNLIESSLGSDPEPPSRSEPMRMTHRGDDAENDDDPEEVAGLRAVTSDLTLAQVAGMNDVKQRLEMAFLAPMRTPDLRKLYKKSLKGGLLLYGPPGCGKTFLARAIAGELGSKFLSIGLTDVVDMYIGESEKNLHRVFELARRSKPCVLFIDEIDALGRKRSLMRNSGERNVVNQLLSEMDGVEADNEGVYVLAATNHPWDVDSALRRPGRFDRTVLVLPPDVPARAQILQSAMEDRPVNQLDYSKLADQAEDFSGADLVHWAEAASELAMADSIRKGTVRSVDMGDFKQAKKDVKPSTRPWFETAKNFAVYANEGGTYDDLIAYLKSRRWM
jgi:SpoVK/Ycf46/Vps4 family AAA+-type ATPase